MCVLGMLTRSNDLCQHDQHTRRNKNAQLPDLTQSGKVHGLHQDKNDIIKIDAIITMFPHAPDFQHQYFKCF